jgi:hypothetical protein
VVRNPHNTQTPGTGIDYLRQQLPGLALAATATAASAQDCVRSGSELPGKS